MSTRSTFKTVIAAAALCVVASSAFAQYMWLDEKGVKQFSDMPPPPSIPKKNILKSPGSSMQPKPASGGDSASNAAAADSASSGPMTTAEKNAAYNKRKIAEAEAEKKQADQAKFDADKAKNCERARSYKRSLDSGERIGRTEDNGDKSFLSDEQRAKDSKEAKTILDNCKS